MQLSTLTSATRRLSQAELVELCRSVSDLKRLQSWRGAVKSLTFIGAVVGLCVTALHVGTWPAIIVSGSIAGLFYAGLISMSHDALHSALTGWKRYETWFGRLVGIPFLYPYLYYRQMHRLHHIHNGLSLEDPERYQMTEDEYARAGPLVRWFTRRGIIFHTLLGGGFGLIIGLLLHAPGHWKRSPRVRLALVNDACGILGGNALLFYWASRNGLQWRYLAFVLIVERVAGGIHQVISRLAHYELWGQFGSYLETQLETTRTVRMSHLMTWFVNYLNVHTVHHMFPKIPFYNLPEAHRRVRRFLGHSGRGMLVEASYVETIVRVLQKPSLISSDGRSVLPLHS